MAQRRCWESPAGTRYLLLDGGRARGGLRLHGFLLLHGLLLELQQLLDVHGLGYDRLSCEHNQALVTDPALKASLHLPEPLGGSD